MKPSIGRTVIVHGIHSNCAPETAAIVTRVWSNKDTAEAPVLVNLTVFPDCSEPQARGSIMLYDTRELALAAANSTNQVVAHWPERI